MHMVTESTNVVLPYRPAHPQRRRIRRIAVVLLCLGMAGAGWKWGLPLAQQANFLYWQHRCMAYQPPTGKVAFEADPASAAALLQSGAEYCIRVHRRFNKNGPPAGWTEPAFFRPRALDQIFPGPTYAGVGIAFMHGRQSLGGTQHFVVVTVGISHPYGDGHYFLDISPVTYASATWALSSKPVMLTSSKGLLIPISGTQHPRVYFGEADPNDESKFTIRYELDGQTHVITGQLHSDNIVTLAEAAQLDSR